MKIFLSAIAVAALLSLTATSDANPNVFCTQRTGYGDYQCYPVYGGLSYPTGANTEFTNNAPFTVHLSGWYTQGCGASPVFATSLGSGQGTQHFAFDPFQNRNVLYVWCAYDATPSTYCHNGQTKGQCL